MTNNTTKNSQNQNIAEDQELGQVEVKIKDLETQLEAAQSALDKANLREKLALADYQNLVRRSAEDRIRTQKLACISLVQNLIVPLSHLSLASKQLNDKGLDMVVNQLWQTLNQEGLEKIDVVGKEFDVNTMEVVDKGEKGQKVVSVVTDGYKLNGEVIQHAKVVLD